MGERSSPLGSIPNFRDVGTTVNQISKAEHEKELVNPYEMAGPYNRPPIRCQKPTGYSKMKTGVLFRGARPDEASFQDRERLVKEYKIKSIIDLRTKTEHIEQAQKRNAKIRSSEAVPQTNEETAEPLRIPGIKYYDINFNGTAFSRMLISKLTWMEFFRLVFLMIFGYRTDAIKILAPHMEKLCLCGIAVESVDVCKKEVKQFFDVISDADNLPVFVHCTQGKDRTGLTIMLLLHLLNVDLAAIEQDYLMSGPELAAEMDERVEEIAKIGLSRRFAHVDSMMTGTVNCHIELEYGGIEEYLEKAGVSRQKQERVKSLFLED